MQAKHAENGSFCASNRLSEEEVTGFEAEYWRALPIDGDLTGRIEPAGALRLSRKNRFKSHQDLLIVARDSW